VTGNAAYVHTSLTTSQTRCWDSNVPEIDANQPRQINLNSNAQLLALMMLF